MQAHVFAPHHHHGDPVAIHAHIAEYDHSEVEHGDTSTHAQLTEDHDHHHLHDHADEAAVRKQRSSRISTDFVAVLPDIPSLVLAIECPVVSRISHPFVPFQTGPPGVVASRGPPLPTV